MIETDEAAPEATAQDEQKPIFEQLVDAAGSEPRGLRGIVAYGLYKAAKREWASQTREQHGRSPTKAELDQYAASWTDSRLDGVRSQADQILAAYASYVVAEAQPGIMKDAIRGAFGRSFWASFWAVLALALLLAALWVVLATQGIDLFGAAGRAVSQ